MCDREDCKLSEWVYCCLHDGLQKYALSYASYGVNRTLIPPILQVFQLCMKASWMLQTFRMAGDAE